MQNIKAIEISSFWGCPRKASQILSIHKKVHTSHFWHPHAKALSYVTIISCTKFGKSWRAMSAMGGTHTTIAPPEKSDTCCSFIPWLLSITCLDMHPHSSVRHIKGKWFFLCLTRGWLFHRTNLSLIFPSKEALTNFPRREVERKREGEPEPRKMEEGVTEQWYPVVVFSLPDPKEGYWET